jgi:hypothetical protein
LQTNQARAVIKLGKAIQFGGAVAQLGARLDGIEEVVGSNPIGSTNFKLSGISRRRGIDLAESK